MADKEIIPINQVIFSYYERIFRRYDCVNSWITFGMDEYWRRKLAERCKTLPKDALIIDLCTGTGKMVQHLQKVCPTSYFRIVGVDFSIDMLRQRTWQAEAKEGKLSSVSADARYLPFPDRSVSVITTAFATRNLDARRGDYEQVMAEVKRVLMPNGLWMQLETAQPGNRLVKWIFHRFVGLWVPFISRWLGEDRSSYRFLIRSIQLFNAPEGLSRRLQDFGFKVVVSQRFLFGAACLLLAGKKE